MGEGGTKPSNRLLTIRRSSEDGNRAEDFPWTGRRLSDGILSRQFKRACRASGGKNKQIEGKSSTQRFEEQNKSGDENVVEEKLEALNILNAEIDSTEGNCKPKSELSHQEQWPAAIRKAEEGLIEEDGAHNVVRDSADNKEEDKADNTEEDKADNTEEDKADNTEKDKAYSTGEGQADQLGENNQRETSGVELKKFFAPVVEKKT